MNYNQLVITLEASQALVIISTLFLRLETRKLSNLLLALLFFHLMVISFICFIYLEEGITAVLKLKGLGNFCLLGLGPILLFYLKTSLIPNFRMHRLHYKILIPYILGALFFIPGFFVSNDVYFGWFYADFEINYLFIRFVLGSLVVLFYIHRSWRLVERHHRFLNEITADDKKSMLQWSRLLIGLVSVSLILSMLVNFGGASHFLITLALEFLTLSFFVVAIFSHSRSSVLVRASADNEFLEMRHLEIEAPHNLESETPKYKTSPLTDSQMRSSLAKLTELIESDSDIFVKPNLQLSDLAKILSIPSYIASQVINEGLNKNFYDLVNEQRIGRAQKHLSDPAKSDLSIIDVAYDVGYNSKSTFNSSFKKYVGMTPSQWRKSNFSV